MKIFFPFSSGFNSVSFAGQSWLTSNSPACPFLAISCATGVFAYVHIFFSSHIQHFKSYINIFDLKVLSLNFWLNVRHSSNTMLYLGNPVFSAPKVLASLLEVWFGYLGSFKYILRIFFIFFLIFLNTIFRILMGITLHLQIDTNTWIASY